MQWPLVTDRRQRKGKEQRLCSSNFMSRLTSAASVSWWIAANSTVVTDSKLLVLEFPIFFRIE